MTSPIGFRHAISPRPGRDPTRRTTRPPWSRRTTTSSAYTHSTGDTIPIRYATTADGRRKRLYDTPRTPWQLVQESGLLTHTRTRAIEARIAGVNPADLTRRINTIQLRLIELSQAKTEAMITSKHLNMASLETSIRRLQTTK